MPHTVNAAKRHRQSEERRIRNKDRLTELKTLKKSITRAIHDGNKAEAETLYQEVTKRIDQATSVKTVHKNTASRTKARLAKAIAGTKTPEAKSSPAARAAAKAAAPKAAAPKAAKK